MGTRQFRGVEIYGVGSAGPGSGAPSVARITRTLRERDGLPPTYVVLDERDDASVIAHYKATTTDRGEAPVVQVRPGET